MTSQTITITYLKTLGYTCEQELLHGLLYWRVRDAAGRLAIHRASTYRSPASAWAEACRLYGTEYVPA